MVKLNKKILSLNGDDEEASGIDWQQLMANFQSQSVEEALKNIMDNVKHFLFMSQLQQRIIFKQLNRLQ